MNRSVARVGIPFAVAYAAACLLWSQDSVRLPSRGREPGRALVDPNFFPPDASPRWPLTPATQAYAPIQGDRLREYVKELTEISHHSRDRGEQLWGRITGTQADDETAEWFATKLKQMGIADVHRQALDLPPQSRPVSWNVVLSGNGKTLKLDSAVAGRGAPGTPAGGLDLEAAWVGLGTEADFKGREVRGKAVFIYAMPLPGPWAHSATRYDSVRRAEQHGAAAVFLSIAIPGNYRTVVGSSTTVPGFTLGQRDGEVVREAIEKAPEGSAPRVKIHSDVQLVTGGHTLLVWGVIPGNTDENIVINAHRDGYYEAANDNGTGVATALGLAEYFAKIPRQNRRRNVIVIGNPGHHNTPVGSQWLVAHKDMFYAKAALLINCEHTAQVSLEDGGVAIETGNMPSLLGWFIGGGARLAPLVIRDWDLFGVPRTSERSASPAGDIGLTYKLAPSIQLINATQFYHTDHDTLATVPESGLENVTRAFAKIIDDVNQLDLKDLAWPSASATVSR
jgi:Peptidase family M28